MTPQPKAIDWLAIGFLGLVWGGTFMIVAIALEGYGPVTVATSRTTLGALGLLAILKLTGRAIPWGDRQLWRFIIPIGLFSTAVPFVLLSWGQQYVPSAFAGLSMAALPLFVLPLAHVFSGELMSQRKVIGVVLGFVGAAILIGPGVFAVGSGDYQAAARLACLGAALAYSISSVTTRQCPPMDPIVLSALALMVGVVVLVPVMLLTEGLPGWAGMRPGLALIFLGVVPTALATVLRVIVIQRAGSVFLTLVNYQVPVWSMVFGAWILSEALPLRFFAALALILLGVAISQWYSLMAILGRAKA